MPTQLKISGSNNGTSKKAVLFSRWTECSKRKFVLHLLKPIFDISFRLLHRFIIFFSKELICANGKHDWGKKLLVLNFSHHSPKPTDFLNLIIHTIMLLLFTFSHRFVFYWFLLYRHKCFTGKYTTRKIHKRYIRDPSGLFSIISQVSLSMT